MQRALPSPAPAPTEPDGAARRSAAVLGPLLVLAAVVAPYARTLGFDALTASDAEACGARSLAQAWHAGGLGSVSLWLAGLPSSALGARVLSLALYAGASALVAVLLRRLGASSALAVTGALLWALHPMHVEATAWLAQQGTLLGTCAFLLGACLALGPEPRCTRGSWAALALALVAEPRALLALPALFLLQRRQTRARGCEPARLGPPAWALAALGLASLALVPASGVAGADRSHLAHLPAGLAALGRLWFLPDALTPHHPVPQGTPGALGWSALALGTALLAWLVRNRSPLAPGLALFALAGSGAVLLPAGPGLFAEASAPLASLGLVLAATSALGGAGVAGPALLLLATLACAVRTHQRLDAWRDEGALQARALALNTHDVRAHDALGLWHLAHGRLSAAQREHDAALARTPDDALALLHRGALELRRGLIPGQEEHLLAAEPFLQRAQALPRARASLAEVRQRLHDDARARELLESALADEPLDARAWTRLGMARRNLGDAAGARAAFERATALDPRSSEAWCGLGLAQEGDGGTARACFERALALEPDHVESNAALGRILEADGDPAGAERCFRRAVGVNPDSAEALFLLGELCQRSGRSAEALRAYDRVAELPRAAPHVRACLASARLRMERGETEVPRARIEAVLRFNGDQAEARALLHELERMEGR